MYEPPFLANTKTSLRFPRYSGGENARGDPRHACSGKVACSGRWLTSPIRTAPMAVIFRADPISAISEFLLKRGTRRGRLRRGAYAPRRRLDSANSRTGRRDGRELHLQSNPGPSTLFRTLLRQIVPHMRDICANRRFPRTKVLNAETVAA